MNWNINLNLYKSFYYVAKHGGFTKASMIETIPQSSLSSSIKKLESDLDELLFIREGSKIKLTEEGEKLYLKLQEIYDILSSHNDNKKINIGCLRFIVDNYLYNVISTIYSYNYTQVSLHILDSGKLYQGLKKSELDLVISRYPTFYRFEDNIVIEELCTAENVFVCSKQFLNINLQKINKPNYIFPLILPNHSEKRRIIEKYLKEKKCNYEVVLEIPNSNLLKKLICKGIGIGYVNKDFIKKELENDELIIVDFFKEVPSDRICLMYNRDRISKEVTAVINTINMLLKK